MSVTINDGELFTMDSAERRVITVDWDRNNLGPSVQIASSTFVITVVSGSALTPLTKDNEATLTGVQATAALGRTVGDSRATQLRIIAPLDGTRYKVDNEIVTNESPAQTKNRFFLVLGQDR